VTGSRIVIFAKEPVPGRVKTRLIPALGAEGAADLARDMLADTLEEARASGLAVELCGDPDPAAWHEPLPAVGFAAQGTGDLGERLARAAARVLGEGDRILLIGTDCPGLDRGRLRAAARALDGHDAVIHPTLDGGYALLGLRRSDELLFAGISWSTAKVAEQTIARVRALGWRLRVLEKLRDIDEPADLVPSPLGEGKG
jgi:uncharacterized protein